MLKYDERVRKNINMQWRTEAQREVYRHFLNACKKIGRHPTFVLEDLLRSYLKRHGGDEA